MNKKVDSKLKTENDEQLTELIQKHSDSVRNICKKYFLHGGNQEDLFQEGMIGFLQAVKSYNNEKGGIDSETFTKFALMCAKRQILDAIKHANRKKNQPLNDYVSIHKTNINESKSMEATSTLFGHNPEEEVIEKEESEAHMRELRLQLTAFEKQVLQLYLEGKSYQAIAGELNKDSKSIDNTIQRIKKKLKA